MNSISQYVYRLPQPLPVPGPKKISTPAGTRLSTILEGNPNSPRQGFSLANLTSSRSERHGAPPRHSEEKRPPSYATQESAGMVRPGLGLLADESPSELRESHMRRGGWKRLAVIVLLVVVALAVAIGVGVGVGLHKHGSSAPPATSPSSPIPQGPFPIGSYGITAFLTNITTSCASNSLTWTCYPGPLYSSSSPIGSEAPFNWIVTALPNNSTAYQISSSDNPLSILFANVSLILMDKNLATERYTFSVPNIVKNVLPAVSLTGDNVRSTCFYNSTTLTASLYTRMNATLLDGVSPLPDQPSSGLSFNTTWPGAVMVQQIANGGSDVPNCYRLSNGFASGAMLPLTTETSTEQCSCTYSNFDAS